MQKLLHFLFITTFIYCTSLGAMENNLIHTNALQLPKEIIAHLAGYCQPKEKNILMRLCKDFCACLKDRTLILKANPSTVSTSDKIRELFKYTYANNTEMMEFLIKNGVNANCKNILGITPFHVACDHGKSMQLLIDLGANKPTLKPVLHILHEAVYKGDKEAVKKLLNQGVDPNIYCDKNITPLFIASHEGCIAIVKLLLDAGAKVNQVSNDLDTPLTIAIRHGHIAIVELLLSTNKAKVNHADNLGNTPLIIAAQYGRTSIVKLLISAKAKVNYVNDIEYNQWTPLLVATQRNHTNIVALLISAGAKVNHADRVGRTPLLIAASYNNVSMVKLLLDNGANINYVKTGDGQIGSIMKGDTALEIAQRESYTQTIELLQERLRHNKTTKKKKPKKTIFFS